MSTVWSADEDEWQVEMPGRQRRLLPRPTDPHERDSRSGLSVVADANRWSPLTQRPNDLSKSPTVLKQHNSLLAVIEISLSSSLVTGIVLGVERQPLKTFRDRRERIAEASQSPASGSGESRMQDRTCCDCLRGRSGRFLVGALAQSAQHRDPCHPRIERSRIS